MDGLPAAPDAFTAAIRRFELARDYRLRVVAVGVEDKATFDLVAGLGCDMAQGYWVSRPLVPDRLRPARRWVAGLAFTGVVAFGTYVSANKVASAGRVELALVPADEAVKALSELIRSNFAG